MPRVIVIHHDKAARAHLENLARRSYEVEGAVDLLSGVKQIGRRRPDVIVIGQDREKSEALRLLKWMQENVLKIPVVVVLARGSGSIQPALTKLGAKVILEAPVEEARLIESIQAAMAARMADQAGPPPMTDEELSTNISVLESRLNKAMKCFAGTNKVYIQSMILGGRTSRPRISLKCGLRAEYGLNKDVYYEFIRDTCCGNPACCEAIQRFQADQRETA